MLRLPPLSAACSMMSASYSSICSCKKLLLIVAAHADALEAGMRDNDGIPIAGGDFGRQVLAAFLGEIFLGGDQQLGIGIDCRNSRANCSSRWLGTAIEGFLDKPGLLHFHAGGGHDVRTCRPRRNGPAAYCRCSSPARRRLSGAGGAGRPGSFPERPGASRRTAVGRRLL